MSQQQFRNVVYLSDRGGCGKWRKIWPIQSIDCVAQNNGIQIDYSQTPILDPRYYQGVNSITIQTLSLTLGFVYIGLPKYSISNLI